MKFTWHMLLRSLLVRRSRSLTGLTAIMVAATIATALLNLYADAHAKFADEFRGFGVNVAIFRESGTDINIPARTVVAPEPYVPRGIAEELKSGETAVPLAFVTADDANGRPVVVVGTDLPKLRAVNAYWQTRVLSGNVTAPLIGSRVYERGGWQTLTFVDRERFDQPDRIAAIQPAMVITSGDADDSRIFIDLDQLRHIYFHIPVQTVLVQIPGDAAHVRSRIGELRHSLEDGSLRVEAVGNIVDTQLSVLTKMHAVMWLSTLLIATIAALSLWASLSASVLERRRDIAVLKALGASSLNVTYTFLLEQVAIGVVGALLGYVLGCAVSALIGYVNFHSIVWPRLNVLPVIIVGATIIVIVGALIPLQRLQKIAPAAILKGD